MYEKFKEKFCGRLHKYTKGYYNNFNTQDIYTTLTCFRKFYGDWSLRAVHGDVSWVLIMVLKDLYYLVERTYMLDRSMKDFKF